MRTDKYNLTPLIRVNFVNPAWTRRQQWMSVLGQLLVPLVLGGVACFAVARGFPISNGIGVVLPGCSLLVGAMFGAFVFLTNLRIKLSESATYAFRADLQRLVGFGAAGCMWVAVVAIALAGLLGLVGSLPELRGVGAKPFVVGVLVVVATHLGMSLIATVRRLIVIYIAMFAADFDPPVGPGPVKPRKQRSKTISK